MSERIQDSHFAMARQINAQVCMTESRNNLPVVNSRPLSLGLDISNVCNVRCIFCLAENGRLRASDEGAFRKPEWLDPFEPVLPFVRMAILSSYEAILNPWLDRFVDRLWAFRTPIQIFSNGNAMEPELSEYLLEHNLQSLWCSFHGVREKTYASIMKGSNYAKVVANLMHMKLYCRKRNLHDFALTMVFCAMRRTIGELLDYVDLAHRVGAKAIQVNYLLVTRPGTGLDHEAMCFHPDLYDDMVLRARLKAARLGIALTHQPLFGEGKKDVAAPCFRPWEHLNVGRDGQATVCCGGCGTLGNLFTEGFTRLWNSRRLMEFRSRVNSDDPPAVCRTCTRGREDPWDVTGHLTYLRALPDEEVRRRVAEVTGKPPAGLHVPPPAAQAQACRP